MIRCTQRLAAVAVLAVFAAAALADGPAAKNAKAKNVAPVKVPFDLLKTQHMTVMVKVNGAGPFRLIFDTGAPVTLLSNKVAKAGGLVDREAKGAVVPLFPGMGQYRVKNLEVGGLVAKDVPVLVMDHPTVKLVSKYLGPIEGIVGFSFFGRYRMTIDYQTKEMTFVPVDFQPPDVMAKMMTALAFGKGTRTKVVAPAGQWGFSVQKEKGDAAAGVDVKAVVPEGPAAKAGLKAGDRLLTLDGRWTDTVVDTYRAASHVRPGSTARLVVRRDGKEVELDVAVQPGL
ncbi:MAG: PDZ domain-containing protein [Gemmataceae bacterium]|nr:PDZ domain-containing protein [Gemmataceae bacterium]